MAASAEHLSGRTLCELPPQRVRVDEVDERALAADLDDGQPLAVPRFQLRIAADVDLVEPIAELRLEDGPRLRAERAARRAEQRYG